MSKKTGVTLVGIGLAAQIVDVLTTKGTEGGVLFGPGGILRPVDEKIPKVTLFAGVQTNIAFWLIVLGAIIWIAKRR